MRPEGQSTKWVFSKFLLYKQSEYDYLFIVNRKPGWYSLSSNVYYDVLTFVSRIF